MGMSLSNGAQQVLPKIAKNTILRDKVNDQQVDLAKTAPQMIKNPKKLSNDERTILTDGVY